MTISERSQDTRETSSACHVHVQFYGNLLLVDVNELIDTECSENTTLYLNISNYFTRLHPSKGNKLKRSGNVRTSF